MSQISVVVPVYNVEKYLPRCIDSILRQTYTDFELLLVDDGSPDGCPAICDAYAQKDARVQVFHQKNAGAAQARNVGIDYAVNCSSSQWIAFADSDDYVHPQYLEQLFHAAESCNANVSVCKFISVQDEACVPFLPINQAACLTRSFADFYADFSIPRVNVWDKLWKKELFKDIRYPVGKVLDDVYIVYRLLYLAQTIATTDAVLYYYYQRANSTMHSAYSLKMLDGLDACKEQLQFFCEKRDAVNAQTAYRQLIHSYAEHCRALGEQKKDKAFAEKRMVLIKELRRLLRNKRFAVSIEQDAAPLETAYPKRMWMYWTYKGLCRKLCRKNTER